MQNAFLNCSMTFNLNASSMQSVCVLAYEIRFCFFFFLFFFVVVVVVVVFVVVVVVVVVC